MGGATSFPYPALPSRFKSLLNASQPGPAHYYRVFCKVCLHIQKPKPQATIKNEMKKIHNLFDVYNTMHKR